MPDTALLKLSVLLRARRADLAVAALYEAGVATVLVQEPGDLGTEGDPVPAGRVRLVAFGDPPTMSRARDLLAVRARARPILEPFADRDWLKTYRVHHRAVRVGRRLVVAPPWSRLADRPGRAVVRIDPGLAFGTGSHASTYLCLRALVDLARRRPLGRVLDVGTGSGVLAFAALRLGARSAKGIEPDPEALAAARANARLNRMGRRLVLGAQSAEAVRGRFDTVLANLLRDLLMRHARNLADRVAPGGVLVVSGILDGQADEVRDGYAALGLGLARRLSREGWSALVMRRPG